MLAQYSPFQVSSITIEDVLIARIRARIGVLPERLVAPACGERTHASLQNGQHICLSLIAARLDIPGSITSEPERVCRRKGRAIACTSRPPVRRRVDD
jgi:hypothetical protein